MSVIRIKEDFDLEKLEELGYKFIPIEGGYASKDFATIITTHRAGHIRKVMQFRANVETEHMANVEQLRQIDAIE